MMNRLLLPWQRQLLLIVGLIPWALALNAQCECGTATNSGDMQTCSGDLFTLEYTGQDTFFVGASCMEPLFNPSGSINIMPGFDTVIYDANLTGYPLGADISGGTVVNIHYIVKGSGVSDTLCFNISFIDTIPPVINTTLSNDTFACEVADYPAWLQENMDSVMANFTDNCGSGSVSHSGTATFTNNCNTQDVTFYITDPSGNVDSVMASFTTIDTVGPVLANLPADVFINCEDPIPDTAMVTATDACAGSVSVTFSESSSQTSNGTCNDNDYTIIRTWTATDSCGNTTMATQTINVQDITPPSFSAPADTTITCDAPADTMSTGNISMLMDCSSLANLTITMSEVSTSTTCPQEKTITRTWTVTDPCLNSFTDFQTIEVVDTVAPVITFPADITVDCADAADLNVTGQPTAVSDNCDSDPTVSSADVQIAGLCDDSYTIERTWTVTDACGMSVSQMQTITVTDEVAPVISIPAVDQSITCSMDIDALFTNWVNSNGGNPTVTDNCTDVADLTWEAFDSGTTNAAVLHAPDCVNPDTGIYRQATVDFIVTDKCGNQDTTTATFKVADNTAPTVLNCPTNMVIDADPGICEADRMLPLPVVMENCGNTVTPVSVTMSKTPTIPAGSNPVETPIDDIVFDLSVPAPPNTAAGNAALTIKLNDIDGEAPTEFLNVYGEDNTFLGKVDYTPAQCTDTMTTFAISASQINAWAFDGVITITVKPNIPAGQSGIFAVNPICPNNSVTAELVYENNSPDALMFEYSVDNSDRIPVAPIADINEILEQGANVVTYYFTDCAGNETSCDFEITVEDKESPSIICPSDISVNLAPGNCEEDVEIPLFSSVSDNCGVTTPTTQTQPDSPDDRLITYSYNPNLGDFVADDKTFIFNGLQGDATPGGVSLIITVQADIDSIGEYFEIYDNDGMLLGTTANGQGHVTPGNCNTPSTATFTIPAETFNDWATAGDIQITAKSFVNYPIPPAGPSWGINPCDTSQVHNDGDTDGSFIYATFSYESVTPTFGASGATSIDPVELQPPLEAATYTLAQGTTTFSYSVIDLAGNQGECTFEVTLTDTEAPTALCGPTFTTINPSGIEIDTILPSEIDLGSFDNCTIDTMYVTPNIVTCADQGILNVTLTVIDGAGIASTCNTFVNVTTEAPAPTAQSDCGSTDLQLFANPPASSGGGSSIYTYTWMDPNGVPFSFEENPVIQDADLSNVGFYTVVIEGVTGECESMSSTQVTCDILPLQKPVAQVFDNNICESENIQLSTAAVCGTNVEYQWYSGNLPGTLMATTQTPNYTIQPPAAGTFSFYVVVVRNGCESAPAEAIDVTVNAAPTALAAEPSIIVCENEQILLESLNNPVGASCQWTGPAGYVSNSCNPAPIASSTLNQSGFYQLIVTQNGCESVPDTVTVNVIERPEKPSATSTTSAVNPACDGETIILTATSVPGAVSYNWTSPMFTEFSSPSNIFTIPACDLTKDAGTWTVTVIGNPCESEPSEPFEVYIEPLPEAVEASANPVAVCEGQSVEFAASSGTQNVSFLWTYPSGETNASQNPILPNVEDVDAGMYELLVTSQFGCTAEANVELEVLNRVDITGIASDVPNCPPGPIDVHLVSTLFPQDDGTYQYLWTGPNNYESTDASATISDATSDDTGPYILTVTNGQGCTSLPMTLDVAVPEVLAAPPAPVTMSGVSQFCEGESLTIETEAYQGGNAIYIWMTPSGAYSTSTASLTLDDLTVAEEGAYSVQYLVGDCTSSLSANTMIEVNAAPVISPTSNSPVCEGAMLELTVECDNGAEYEWTGPNGFSPSVCNPSILNTTPDEHTGTYTVRKMMDGCWSEVVTLDVEVKEKPEVPTAINAGPYCADTDDVILSVTGNSATPGAMYTWYDENDVPLGNGTPALNFTAPNATQYGNGTAEFYVVAMLDGCPSTPSVTTVVELNTIPPNLAEAGPSISACDGDILTLQATAPTVGTGFWTLTSGNPNSVTIANPDEATTTLAGIVPGDDYVFTWTLSNGACVDYSSDVADVFVNFVEQAEAGDPITLCHTTELSLSGNTPVSNIGEWSQPQSQALLGVEILEPGNPSSPIAGVVPGNQYIFTWTIDGGCGSTDDQVLVTVTDENAYAGMDMDGCGDGCVTLDAQPSANEQGKWTSPNPEIEFIDDVSENSIACNLQPGENILVWTIDGGVCGHYSIDTVLVDYRLLPIAVDDFAEVEFGGSSSLNVTNNDEINDLFTISIMQQAQNGHADIDSDGNLTYTSNANFVGEDFLIYEICAEGCECVTGTVTFDVGKNAECIPPTIFTPNKDGMNDSFVIPCLENNDQYPYSAVSIFNQWGDEVFHGEPYQNDWEGTFDGQDLPAGTYFYFIDLGQGVKPISGYLILQR